MIDGTLAYLSASAPPCRTPGYASRTLHHGLFESGCALRTSHHGLRALALARQFSAAEAEALRQGAKEIREARDLKGPAGAARQKEHQAILDVLDGLCLLLLREVFRALGTAAELTPKVRRPTLYTLRSYYVRAGVIEADDEAPPVA